jgi:hypothetical protein
MNSFLVTKLKKPESGNNKKPKIIMKVRSFVNLLILFSCVN